MTEMEAEPNVRIKIVIMPIVPVKTVPIMPVKTLPIMSVKTLPIMTTSINMARWKTDAVTDVQIGSINGLDWQQKIWR